MKSFCKHTPHVVIDDIWEPKYSTREVLINVNKLKRSIDNYLIKFSKAKSMPGWYWVDLKTLSKCKTQRNGAGTMIVCPLSNLEDFEPIKENCGHDG